jgi:hypothetical protein
MREVSFVAENRALSAVFSDVPMCDFSSGEAFSPGFNEIGMPIAGGGFLGAATMRQV